MENKFGKILVIDDNEDILHAARLLLKNYVASVRTEKNPMRLEEILRSETFDLILLDMNFTLDVTSGQEGFFWLKKILEIDPSAIVVLITAYGDIEMAVRAIKDGAADFVLKPWQNEKLVATISSALNLKQSRREAEILRQKQRQLSDDLDKPFHNFIAASSAMMEIFRSIQKIAKTDASVLVLGENGTGKELIARELHRQSSRADQVFLSVDMGAISETIFESELFGHVKGAFTDAREDRAGRFETASGGTLFLDEIGNIPISLQVKLLAALEQRQVIRLGSNKALPIDIRLICATNLPIREMAVKKEFRQDLLYRINTIEIHLPPLRERTGDIPLLADHFLSIYCKKYRVPEKKIDSAAMKKLQQHCWPGNVRELQHSIERAIILHDKSELQPEDFLLTAEKILGGETQLHSSNLEETEKFIIHKVIQKNEGNISKAANELGLTRASLYRRMERYGL